MMSEHDDLIDRLEAATRPNRKLDDEIATVLWGEPRPSGNAGQPKTLLWWSCGLGRGISPEFTGSIDAALMTLPEWASFELQQSSAGPATFTRCRLHDWHRSPTGFDPGNEWKSEGNRPIPINICIAALRARAATDESKPDRSKP